MLMELFWACYYGKNYAHVLCELLYILEEPEKDWAKMLEEAKEAPPEPTLFD